MKITRFWLMMGGGIFIALAALAGVAGFIIFNAQAAADFTDNYLRPILGENTVIAMERVFYNTSDKVRRITSHGAVVATPEFLGAQSATTIHDAGSRLNLLPISPLQGLSSLPGEGIWQTIPLSVFPGKSVMAETFYRPDANRPYAVVTMVQADMKALGLGIVAGKKDPGGSFGKVGPGVVPPELVQNGTLVAAFNGGFLYEDGQYGLQIGDTVYAPLKNDTAALVSHADGRLEIINYTGQALGADVNFVRENCPILIDNGELGPNSMKHGWGRTTTSDIYTWRSGIGITKDGNLLYAAGNNLQPITLATALQAAGAVQAMQLDINPAWVKFNLFAPAGAGQYTSVPLTKELHDGAKRFLGGNNKDFFYLYQK